MPRRSSRKKNVVEITIQPESKYSTPGWKNSCDIPDAEIDNKIKQIDSSFSKGTIDTFVLFQSKDFQVNVNYNNMVMAMCTKDIFTVDLDFRSGYWNDSDALDTIELLTKYTNFMHQKGRDLLFKIYRTDKGMHAILVNKKLQSYTDEAVKMSVALCNDPFYTAFSKIYGYCLRINPKVYRKMEYSKTLASRVTSEIVSKEYNSPKFIGYGKPDPRILKILELKNSLVNFSKQWYKKHFERMTKLRYIPYIDDFRMCPPREFFSKLIEYTTELYSNINPEYQLSDYEYNFVYNKLAHSSLATVYRQEDFSLSFDLYEYIWSFSFYDIFVVKFKKLDLQTVTEVTEGLEKLSNEGNAYAYFLDNQEIICISTKKYEKDSKQQFLDMKNLHEDIVINTSYHFRVGPLVNVDTKNNVSVVFEKSNFIQKLVDDEIVFLGEAEQEILNIFELAKRTDQYLSELYSSERDEMTKKRNLREKRHHVYGPSIEKIDIIRRDFISEIENLGSKRQEKIEDLNKFVRSNRYLDILQIPDIRKCYKKLSDVQQQMKILKPYVLKDAGINFLYSNGEYPFVFGQSVQANMIFISAYDILMLDWDVKLGIEKQTAVYILERFLESQRNIPLSKRLFKSEPCFKIYETDNGTHAYLISEFLPHNELIASKLMIDVCSDLNYAAMKNFKGYSIRLSPKIYVDKEYTGPEYIEKQFIQNEGLVVDGKKVLYVGDQKKIIPHIEEFVDIIYRTQKYILSYETQIIYDTLYNRDQKIISEWGDFFISQYRNMKNKRPIDDRKAIEWSRDVDDKERIESILPG